MIFDTAAVQVSKKLKTFLQMYCPAVDVRCRGVTSKGLHTFIGMLRYV